MRENPKPFEVYRHFKGNLYQILTLATDSEDGKQCVVYQAMYGDYKVYVRELAMFLSETDHSKYPDAKQQYRFEKVTMQAVAQPPEMPQASASPDSTTETGQTPSEPQASAQQPQQPDLDPGVLEYIEAETVEARLNILASVHHRITDEMINTMAVVTDVEINEGDVEHRYQELKNCLLMKQKFEKQRY